MTLWRTTALAILSLTSTNIAYAADTQLPDQPNIVFIMADDLGYGDLGCYGQRQVQTPRIDRLAAEGRRFLSCYAGSTVCAPSRCALMTGLHTGHCRVRGNALIPLEDEDVTVAEVLHQAGYATAIVGKWGLGEPDTSGLPNRQGFDYWFGYLNQRHAHNYYPAYLWRNEQRVEIPANADDGRGTYSHDLFAEEAVRFLQTHHKTKAGQPFFVYLSLTLPHANNELGGQTGNGMEVPSDEPYSDRDWPQQQKNHAAMITRLDSAVGQLLDELNDLGIADKTIVFFTSDNGPHREGGADPKFFHSGGPLRGIKRDLYEGGIRVPMIVRWPDVVPADSTSDAPWAFWDVLPTLAELAGASPPASLDGVSVVTELVDGERATGETATHPPLYWEFHERQFCQAARFDRWKVVRSRPGADLELYDLSQDLGETDDVAAAHPEVVARAEAFFAKARTESPHWPVKPRKQGAGQGR